MPFTLAHPAAVLPLWLLSRRLPLLALGVGAMVPDIAYFVALRPTGSLGHTLPGVLIQGVPSGLVLCALWRGVIQAPLTRALPDALAARIPPPVPLRAADLPGHSVGLALGALTHLLWDGFTHASGFAVVRLPVLTDTLGPLPVYKLLQHGGGVLGLGILAVAGGVWLCRQPPTYPIDPLPRRWVVWLWVLSISVLFAGIASQGGGGTSAVVVRGVIGSISGGGLGMLTAALWLRR